MNKYGINQVVYYKTMNEGMIEIKKMMIKRIDVDNDGVYYTGFEVIDDNGKEMLSDLPETWREHKISSSAIEIIEGLRKQCEQILEKFYHQINELQSKHSQK